MVTIPLPLFLTLRPRPSIGGPVLITARAGLGHATMGLVTTAVVITVAVGGGNLLRRPITFEGIL